MQGVGDGLGSAAQYTGGMVGSGVMGAGNMMGLTGKDEKDGSQMGAEAVESTKQTLGEGVDKAGEVGQNAMETSQKAAGDAADKGSELASAAGEQTGLKNE